MSPPPQMILTCALNSLFFNLSRTKYCDTAAKWRAEVAKIINRALPCYNYIVRPIDVYVDLTFKGLEDIVFKLVYGVGKSIYCVVVFKEGTVTNIKKKDMKECCFGGLKRPVITIEKVPERSHWYNILTKPTSNRYKLNFERNSDLIGGVEEEIAWALKLVKSYEI